jgi:hypothetical protein
MIAAELAQGCLVQLKQNFAELFGLGVPGGETLSVNLPQRAEEGVSVLMADLAVVVAVAIVETWHASFPWNWRSCGLNLPNQLRWQTLLPFLQPNSRNQPGLKGASWFEAYPRTEQDQSLRAQSSLRGTLPSELQNRLRQFRCFHQQTRSDNFRYSGDAD